MPTDEEIEAAAQALFHRTCERAAARGHAPHHSPDSLVRFMPPSYRDDYLADARAALLAAEGEREVADLVANSRTIEQKGSTDG